MVARRHAVLRLGSDGLVESLSRATRRPSNRSTRWTRSSDARSGSSACPRGRSPDASRIVVTLSATRTLAAGDSSTCPSGRVRSPSSRTWSPATAIAATRRTPCSSAGRGGQPDAVVRIDLATGVAETIRARPRLRSTRLSLGAEAIEFPTDDGLTAHAFLYAPRNPRFTGRRRAAAVDCHQPRRTDGIDERAPEPRGAVLDEPRLCGGGRELWRQLGLRARVSASGLTGSGASWTWPIVRTPRGSWRRRARPTATASSSAAAAPAATRRSRR